MSEKELYTLLLILVIAAVTLLTRALPFLLFGRGRRRPPAFVIYLGGYLPAAVIAALVIYCFKDSAFLSYPYFLPELISAAAVVALHLWKKNTLVSIFGGTLLYMLLVQFVFI